MSFIFCLQSHLGLVFRGPPKTQEQEVFFTFWSSSHSAFIHLTGVMSISRVLTHLATIRYHSYYMTDHNGYFMFIICQSVIVRYFSKHCCTCCKSLFMKLAPHLRENISPWFYFYWPHCAQHVYIVKSLGQNSPRIFVLVIASFDAT